MYGIAEGVQIATMFSARSLLGKSLFLLLAPVCHFLGVPVSGLLKIGTKTHSNTCASDAPTCYSMSYSERKETF